MKKFTLLFIAIAAVAFLPLSIRAARAEESATPISGVISITETSDANFKRDVLDLSLKQPVMVFFTAPWCGPCRMIQPVLIEIVRARKANVVSIDIDKNPLTPQQFGVSTLPVTIVFRNGLPTDKVTGAATAKIREIAQSLTK